MMWPGPLVNSYFAGVDEIVEAVGDATPNKSHVSPADSNDSGGDYHGRRAHWIGSGYIIAIDADKVQFMEGNSWHIEHAAGVKEVMEMEYTFDVPAARVRRIRKIDVTKTRAREKDGTLLEQYSMVRPWTMADIGKYEALLVDGNHRAAAAMALGEKTIYVYVSENYRKEVRKADWL